MQNLEIAISVIVPVYKIKEHLLRGCLESLKKQKFTGVEYIIIDDGSPDNCGEICDYYSKLDSRIKVIHVENGGVSSARNIGIGEAKGKYIMFVDGDDQLVPNILEYLYAEAENEQVEMLFFANETISENNLDAYQVSCESVKKEEIDCIELVQAIISNNEKILGFKKVKFGSPWGIVFQSDFIKKNRIEFPLNIKKSQDRIFVVRALSFHPRVQVCNITGYIYIENNASICQRYNPEIIGVLNAASEEFNNTIKVYFDASEQFILQKAFHNLEYDFFVNVLRLYFFHPQVKEKAKTKYKEYVALCNEKQNFFKKCGFKGLTPKKKLVLFLLKVKCYRFLYIILSHMG